MFHIDAAREILDETIRHRQQEFLANDPIWQAIGVAEEVDGPTDVSANVDKYLYGEPIEPAVGYPAHLKKVAEDSDEYTPD